MFGPSAFSVTSTRRSGRAGSPTSEYCTPSKSPSANTSLIASAELLLVDLLAGLEREVRFDVGRVDALEPHDLDLAELHLPAVRAPRRLAPRLVLARPAASSGAATRAAPRPRADRAASASATRSNEPEPMSPIGTTIFTSCGPSDSSCCRSLAPISTSSVREIIVIGDLQRLRRRRRRRHRHGDHDVGAGLARDVDRRRCASGCRRRACARRS